MYTLSLHDALPISRARQDHQLRDDLWAGGAGLVAPARHHTRGRDRKSTRLNSSHDQNSYAVFCLKKNTPPKSARGANRPADTRNGKPAPPSGRLTTFSGNGLQFRYPDNWRQYGEGSATTIAPDGGIVNGSLAYGMMIAEFEPDYRGQGRISLDEATDQLLNNLQKSNPNMRVTRNHERTRVGGQAALIAEASNQSPTGGRETDWIVTTMLPDGTMYYFVGVAPQNEFSNYRRAFEDLVDSVVIRGQTPNF